MISFEQAFSDTERAAEAAVKSAANVVSQAKALVKAARSGNVVGIKRGREKLEEAQSALRQDVENLGSCWPFTGAEEEERRFQEGYAAELRDTAAEKGLEVYERDGSLISYPSILRILSGECAVRIDSKKVATVRPSYLADLLLKNQEKSSGFSPQRFLDALYFVYTEITKNRSSDLLPDIPLTRIYKLLTAKPGAARDYDQRDFARDLYILDSEGPRCTKSGATLLLRSADAARGRRSGVFSFIGRGGNVAEYYAISFSEDGK